MQKIAIDALCNIHQFNLLLDLLPKPQCHPAYRRILNAGYPAYRLVLFFNEPILVIIVELYLT